VSRLLAAVLALDYTGALILLPLTYYSYRAYRVSGLGIFFNLFLGFALLSSGTFCHGLSLTLAALGPRHALARLVAASSLASLAAETAAYLLIALGYTRASRAAAPALLLLANWPSPLGTLFGVADLILLAYIVLNALAVYSATRDRSTLLPLLGFSTLLASQCLRLAALAAPRLALASRLLYFLGLLSLLYLAVEVSREG